MSKNPFQKKDWLILQIVFRSDRDFNEIKNVLIKKIKTAQTVLNKEKNVSKVLFKLRHQKDIKKLKSQIDDSKRVIIELYEIFINNKKTQETVKQMLFEVQENLQAIIAKDTMRIDAHKLKNSGKNNDVTIR